MSGSRKLREKCGGLLLDYWFELVMPIFFLSIAAKGETVYSPKDLPNASFGRPASKKGVMSMRKHTAALVSWISAKTDNTVMSRFLCFLALRGLPKLPGIFYVGTCYTIFVSRIVGPLHVVTLASMHVQPLEVDCLTVAAIQGTHVTHPSVSHPSPSEPVALAIVLNRLSSFPTWAFAAVGGLAHPLVLPIAAASARSRQPFASSCVPARC